MREDWEIRKLGELCEFVRGPFGGSLKKSCFVEEGYAVYEQQHAIYDQFNDLRYFIDDEKFEEMKRFELKAGDLIMSCSGTIGKVAIVPEGIEKGIVNQALLKLTPNKSIDVQYLKYWFLSDDFLQSIAKHSKGVAIKNVASVKILKTIEFLLPPLPEQKRIVTILDEAFEAIDQAKANVERNIENAEELFQSKLNEIFSQIRDDRGEVKLGKICSYQNGFAFKSKTYKDSGTPLIRIGDIQDGVIDLSNIKFVERDDYDKDLSRYEIIKGDLLIAMSGATTGKIGIVNKEDIFLLNQRVGKFEPGEQLNKDFLYYFLSTKVEEALNISAGSAQPNLSTKQIKDFLIPLPSIKEQKALVHQLNELSDRVESIIEFYSTKVKGLEELKKSILQKAFSGELKANETEAV